LKLPPAKIIYERSSASTQYLSFDKSEVNETVVKVSAGAASHMRVAKVTNINTCMDDLKKQGFWIYGGDSGGESMYKTDLKGKIALVIGSEGQGMRKLIRESCDKVISIPMFGSVNSLNASTACAVLVYEADRQRKGLK
jgi:23S rRNA (guanosine2251-2'-O)-methyltransferase